MKDKLIQFVKAEAVLIISALCALLSMLFVPVSKAYLEYIDFNVLMLLFSLMSVVAGLQKAGIFYVFAQKI